MATPAPHPISGATAEFPRVLVPVWPARLVRSAGIASTVLGAGHLVGVLRVFFTQPRQYDRFFVFLLFLAIFMIGQGLVLVYAARGVREGLSWARGAILATSGQGLAVMVILMPLFVLAGPPDLFWSAPIGLGLMHAALLVRFGTSR